MKIKICGLSREEDIEYVNEAKPDYAGFIINFPKSHRNVSPQRVSELTGRGVSIPGLDKDIITVGVIVNQPAGFAAGLINDGIVDIVQLHGDEDEEYIRYLRSLVNREHEDRTAGVQAAYTADPFSADNIRRAGSRADNIQDAAGRPERQERIWKAFRIRSRADLDAAAACSADRVLLDSGGGSGRTFDWQLLAETFPRDFILAGGLTPENISGAADTLHPWGIDISSGVETDRVKDRDKILAAVSACRRF